MDQHAQAFEVWNQLQSVSWSKGEQREDFGEESVEVFYGHQFFKKPEEKIKHKILLDLNFKETKINYNNTIIKKIIIIQLQKFM